MAPAIDIIAHAKHFGFNDGTAGLLGTKISARQEHLTNSNQLILVGGMAGAFDLVVEKRNGNLHVNTSTIAGHTIGIHSTTVPDRL